MYWVLLIIVLIVIIKIIRKQQYAKLEKEVLEELGFSNWNVISYYDQNVTVKSRQALQKYDATKFFKENRERLLRAEKIIKRKTEVATTLKDFLRIMNTNLVHSIGEL